MSDEEINMDGVLFVLLIDIYKYLAYHRINTIIDNPYVRDLHAEGLMKEIENYVAEKNKSSKEKKNE